MLNSEAIWMAATISHKEQIAKTEQSANHYMTQSLRNDITKEEQAYCAKLSNKLQLQAHKMKNQFPRIEQF